MIEGNEQGRTFVIADIHGDLGGFSSVLHQMERDGLNLDRDTLIQLGDMIDGYDQSRCVVHSLRLLQQLRPNNVVVLLGNHEDMLIRAVGKHEGQSDFRNWWHQGGRATYKAYHGEFEDDTLPFLDYRQHPYSTTEGFTPHAQMTSDIAWFKTLPLSYETEDAIFVHAGLREPYGPEGTSRWDKLWIREDFHNSTYDWGKPVVYGHTAREEPLIEKNKIGLDCRWRGKGYVSGMEFRADGNHVFYKGM